MLELSHSGLLAPVAHLALAATKSLTLIVGPTHGNVGAFAVAFIAELAFACLASDSSELSHPLGVLEVVVRVRLALLVCIMYQIVGQLVLAATEASVHSHGIPPLDVSRSSNRSLRVLFVGADGLHRLCDV